MILDVFTGLDLYSTDPAHHLITAGYDLNDLDPDLYVRRVDHCCGGREGRTKSLGLFFISGFLG